MDFQIRRNLLINAPQKRQELLMALLPVALADDFSGGNVRSGGPGGNAVSNIMLVRHSG